MKTFVVGECSAANMFRMEDPTVPKEDEFTALVIRALSCVYPEFRCVLFRGTFAHEEVSSQPDLALVARDLSHWFTIEVELVSHSLEAHVLPQIRVLRYGEPQPDCSVSLARSLGISEEHARVLVDLVPRTVVVVANERRDDWENALLGLDAQLVAVSLYSGKASHAFEVDGQMRVTRESLAFGTYSATDRTIRLPLATRLHLGEIQMDDPKGFPCTWIARSEGGALWVTRREGELDLPDRSHVQVIRTWNNRIVVRKVDIGIRAYGSRVTRP